METEKRGSEGKLKAIQVDNVNGPQPGNLAIMINCLDENVFHKNRFQAFFFLLMFISEAIFTTKCSCMCSPTIFDSYIK